MSPLEQVAKTVKLTRSQPDTLLDVGAVLLALILALALGVLAALGRPIPDAITVGLGLSLGYFFGGERRRIDLG